MKNMKGMKREFSELSNRVIGCAIEIHRVLGPGLLESMKLAGIKQGLLINFNVALLKGGLQNFVV